MLGSSNLRSVLGSPSNNRDHTAMRAYIKALCGIGCSVLLIMPGTKQPFDGRTARKRNAEDKAAQQAAQKAGRRDWQKVRSPSGLALATTDAKKLLNKNGYFDEYIDKFGPDVAVNLAIEAGDSGLVFVDCDTPEQLYKLYEVAGIEDIKKAPPPTVVSPGTQQHDGEWAHHDGGHFYFTLTDEQRDALPHNTGSMVWPGDDGFAVLWHRRYVLIPPSTRAEGAYELVGHSYDVPPQIFDAIIERGTARARTAGVNALDQNLATEIDLWAETVSWASILEPLGWTPAGRPDGCGCDVWTAPGNHASPKSATAHDAGCSLGRYTETNAPLHIWTDHPGEPFEQYITANGGRMTLSKLQAVAYVDYDGILSKALDALGLLDENLDLERSQGVDNKAMAADVGADHDPSESFALPGELGTDEDNSCPGCTAGECEFHGIDPDMAADLEDATSPLAGPDTDDEPNPDIFEAGILGLPIIAPFSHWRDMPPPQYIIDDLIEHGGLTCVIGSPGIGKSCVALDMACCIGTGRSWQGRKVLKTRVLYLPGEGLSGSVQRIKAWLHTHQDIPEPMIEEGLRLGNDVVKIGASSEAWTAFAGYVLAQRIGLVVFDTYARAAVNLDENSARDVGNAVTRFDTLRRLTNCGVMIIHHTGKHTPDVARGSSALNGAIESELLISEREVPDDEQIDGKPLQLWASKQRNCEQMPINEQIQLMLRKCEDYSAPYITGPDGEINTNPFDIALARPIEEPVIETAIRIQEFLKNLPEQGALTNEIVLGVRPDAYIKGRADHVIAWKQKVRMAIDLGIHHYLIDTATGARLGSRYVSGPAAPEKARVAHSAEVIAASQGDE